MIARCFLSFRPNERWHPRACNVPTISMGERLESLARLLSKCLMLTSLALDYFPYSIDDLMRIPCATMSLSGLRSISLRGCIMTHHGLNAITRICHSLSIADVSSVVAPIPDVALTDRDFIDMALRCPFLTSLSARAAHSITDNAVRELARRCSSLTTVDLSLCPHLTDASVASLAHHCAETLVSLNISQCPRLTSASLRALAAACHRLTCLKAGECILLPGRGGAVMDLARGCPSLRRLGCEGWTRMSLAAIRTLATHCSTLTEVDLRGCVWLGDKAVAVLASACTCLECNAAAKPIFWKCCCTSARE